jgi:hypothetical protein
MLFGDAEKLWDFYEGLEIFKHHLLTMGKEMVCRQTQSPREQCCDHGLLYVKGD